MRFAGLAALLVGCSFSVPAIDDGGLGGERPTDVGTAPSSPRKLVFTTAGLTSPLVDVPVLVPIAGQVDYSRIVNPRKDLRFEDTTGTVLAYEVETWNPAGESLVWVRVPLILPPPAPASILMYFGTNVGEAMPKQVWTTYEQVNHFAGNADDSTNQAHHGTATGALMAPGYLGSSMKFAGGSDGVTFAGVTLDQWPECTLEMWIKPDYGAVSQLMGNEPQVIDNGGSVQIGRLFQVSTSLVFQIDMKWSGAATYVHPDLPLATWSHVAWVYDQAMLHVYRNGQEVLSDSIGNHDLAATSDPLLLGGTGNGAKMQVDELRISRTARSADWMRAQQLSMTRSFVTFTDP